MLANLHYIGVPEHGCNADEIDNLKESLGAAEPFKELLPMVIGLGHQRLAELEGGLSCRDEAGD